MEVTLLGTGSPVPVLERAGTSILLSIDDENVLVDCGPNTVYRLLENGSHIGEIETLFFTHQHMDHNAAFFHFVIASWSMGRETLDIYGPEGTERLVESLHYLYEEDLEYRTQVGYSTDGIEDIAVSLSEKGVVTETANWRVTAFPVKHSIETYAYRFEELETGKSLVFSGDTRAFSEFSTFADGADVLIQDACIAPPTKNPPTRGFVWERLTEPYPKERRSVLHSNHCTAEEAGEIAEAADVETLVLTHLLPYRNLEYMKESATSAFGGEVIVGEDGLSLSV